MTEEEDYFGWTDASDADGIPSTDDDFAQIDNMPPRDDDLQIDKLPDDLGMEHSFQPGSEDASMSMLLKAAGWHPFLHLFVRISNMLYGNYPEWQRHNILASRHRRMFWYSWLSDQIVQWLCVLGVLAFAAGTAWKALFA